jgi:hypothetical protein
MIGSAGDFGVNFDSKSGAQSQGSGEDGATVRSDESEQINGAGSVAALEDWRPLHTSQMGGGGGGGGRDESARHLSSLPKLFGSAIKVRKGSQVSSSFSESGDNFSSEMKRFEYIKRIIQAAHTPQGYRECLLDQSLDNVITIPVAYMKVILFY